MIGGEYSKRDCVKFAKLIYGERSQKMVTAGLEGKFYDPGW